MQNGQQNSAIPEPSKTDTDSAAENLNPSDTIVMSEDSPIIDCYKRRARIMADIHSADCWMAIGILCLIAAIGFVVL